MKLHSSGEDYLKAIYILQKEKGTVRSIDVAEQMGVSKPSVSHAVKLLRKGGYILMDDDYTLHLMFITVNTIVQPGIHLENVWVFVV